MTIRTMTTVFLSYARGDDEPFVRQLHGDLMNAGFTVWFDRESLLSRGLTFHQEIKDAIRTEVNRVVYVGGPKAAISPYVREEWKFALECDHVVVTPILRLGDYEHVPGELSLLHCEDFRDDANYGAALAKLIASLRQPNPRLGALFAVPSLPPNFLGRPDLMRRVRDALMVDLQKPQIITGADARVGMQGMGGIGKSVLAAALARNRQVREGYPDGVVWIACGQNLTGDDLLKRQHDLARHLGGDDTFASMEQGKGVLRQLLAARAVLLVLDDVWRAADAQPFDVIGPRCRMLVTTRDKGILDALHGELVPVSLFTERESLQLLADSINVAPAALPAQAHEVARECGCLPLALALCGGMARKRGGDFHNVLERLRRADLEKIADRETINEQHRSIWRAMQASVEMLPDGEQQRFAELSVFATDQTVPEAAAATLWSRTGNLDNLDTEELLIELSERSLIQLDQKNDADGSVRRRFHLHDLLYDYAVRIAGEPRALHRKLLDAYRAKCPGGWHAGPDDGYFLQKICRHLATAAGNWDEADELLCDLRFVEARCRAGQVFELQSDYRMVREGLPENQARLREERDRKARMERWTDEIIAYAAAWSDRRDRLERGEPAAKHGPALPEVVPSCRMWTDEEIEAECDRIVTAPTRSDRLEAFSNFVASQCYPLLAHGKRRCFVLQHACNSAPAGPVHEAAGALLEGLAEPHLLRRWPPRARHNPKPAVLRTLDGHTESVCCVSVTLDGRWAVSTSKDGTLRVWDLESGQCLHTLEGHHYKVTSVSVTPDGRRAVSGSWDKTLRVWDLESGQCLRMLEGHTGQVWSVSMTPDGRRAVSGGGDNTLRVWDLESGRCLRTLKGHTDSVFCVSVTPDGRRAVSGSWDKTLRVWDLESEQCLRTLEGHGRSVYAVSVTPDWRRAVSGSEDKTLRVWDLESGQCLHTLESHHYKVTSVSVTLDGRRAVSGSEDWTIRVWDLESGQCLRTLDGHGGYVNSVSVTPDGQQVVSGGGDKTLRVWDLASGQCLRTLKDHGGGVWSVTPDGRRAVSTSSDNMLSVWDLESGECLRTLEGHTDSVECVCVTPDGRCAVSGSLDHTLRVWDLESGQCLRMLKGHLAAVTDVSVTPDGQLGVSGSWDNTLRVWDLESGRCLRSLEGHRGSVETESVTPDGSRVVSGANDIRVWRLETGQCLQVLGTHSPWVMKVIIHPNGRRAVSLGGDIFEHDRTLRIWDLESESCLRVLEGHASGVNSVSITPDGRWCVSGSSDKTLRVWDMESGECLCTLEGHSGWVMSVSVMPDGRRAISGSLDMTLRVWDLESGQCLAVFASDAPIACVTLTRDGRTLVVGATTGRALFLKLHGFP